MTEASVPGTPSEHGVRTDDDTILHTLRWEPVGQHRDQVPFVLVHGLASNALLWAGVGRGLAGHGHVVVAVDQRGHGRSTRPGRRFAPEVLRADLLRVIDSHGLTAPVVVGQSWGGNVALDLAHALPSMVTGAVAIDGGTIDLSSAFDDVEAALEALRPPRLAGTPFAEIEASIRGTHVGWPEEGIQGALANFALRDDGTVEPRLTLEEHLGILRTMWDQDPRRTLRELRVPAMLLLVDHGADDGWGATKRETADAATAANELVTSRWLDGYEHDVHAQAPGLVVDSILTWLGEVGV